MHFNYGVIGVASVEKYHGRMCFGLIVICRNLDAVGLQGPVDCRAESPADIPALFCDRVFSSFRGLEIAEEIADELLRYAQLDSRLRGNILPWLKADLGVTDLVLQSVASGFAVLDDAERDIGTMVRLVKSAAEQGGLLTGAELSLLMNRSLGKIQEYARTWEAETGEALPLKGYVLDMGSSPTHKGIICRKYEEGMSPPDIARATGHTLAAVDNYLGTYDRVKVLLRRGLDVETICQVTGKAKRTIAQYLVIVECYHRDLLQDSHHRWLAARRRKTKQVADPETMAAMAKSLENGSTSGISQREKIAQNGSEELGSEPRSSRKA